jgi:hypothetical protein
MSFNSSTNNSFNKVASLSEEMVDLFVADPFDAAFFGAAFFVFAIIVDLIFPVLISQKISQSNQSFRAINWQPCRLFYPTAENNIWVFPLRSLWYLIWRYRVVPLITKTKLSLCQ